MFKLKLPLLVVLGLFISNNSFAQPELWATTNNGGAILGGTIFKVDTDGNNYSLIYDWDELSNGKRPHSGLLQASNEKLYGVTFQDGSLFGGVLYEYDYITSTYTKKHEFTDATGSFPIGQVIQATNGNLYGLTQFGGAASLGVLYEYNLTTNTYSNLADFDGPVYGGGPHGTLLQAPNGKLYGLNSHGGANGYGTLFEYDITTATLTTKIDLDSINSGYHPSGGLILADNGKMYGLSNFGGTTNQGILFEYDYLTNTIIKHIDFIGANGAFPHNDLFQASNGKLYGLTYEGGSFGAGTLFEFDILTGLSTVKVDFDGGTNGANPKGVLMESSNGKLYGFNSFGGAFNKGVVFEYDMTTEVITTKLDFDGVNGIYNSQNYFIEICAKPTINISSIPNDTLCDNEMLTLTASGSGTTYTWDNSVDNGITFTPSLGTTTYTVSSTNICGTSTHSLDIFVKPTYSEDIYDSICNGNDYTFPDGTTQTSISNGLIDTSFFTNMSGCDSNLIVHLFVKPNYFINTSVQVCSEDSYTFPDGTIENFITSNMSYTSSLQTALLCDSIITTSIEVVPFYFLKDSVFVCPGDSYTFPDGFIENNINSEVIHTSNLTSSLGCDSTIVTTVNTNPVYNVSETVQVCSGDDYEFPDGFTIYNVTSATSHTSNILTIDGCDSIVNTDITVNPIFLAVTNINLCTGDDYTFPDGTTEFNITSDMSQVSDVSSATACDTSFTTNITVFPHYSSIEYDTICFGDPYTFHDGVSIANMTSNTNHTSNISSVYGCDSIITTFVNVNLIDTTIIFVGSSQLVANTTSATYQWFDCISNNNVAGAVFQSFIPSVTSDYALIVSNEYCIDTSSCYLVTAIGLGIDGQENGHKIKIFPNPTTDFVTIEFSNEITNGEISIFTINGQLLESYRDIYSNSYYLDLKPFRKGTYILKLSTNNEIQFVRVTKI